MKSLLKIPHFFVQQQASKIFIKNNNNNKTKFIRVWNIQSFIRFQHILLTLLGDYNMSISSNDHITKITQSKDAFFTTSIVQFPAEEIERVF